MSTSMTDCRWLALAAGGLLLAGSMAPATAQDTTTPAAQGTTTPAAKDTTPAAKDTTPAAKDTTPAAKDTTPAAQEAVQTASIENTQVVSAPAQAVLDRMSATLRTLPRFSVSAEITRDEVLPFGYKLQNNETARMWVERPKKLRVDVKGDIKNRTYLYDGSKLTVVAPDANAYSVAAAPDTLGKLITTLLDAGVEMPLIDLLYTGVAGNLTEAVKVGLLVGESEVDGVPTDHLAFRQADVDWQLWVEKGPRALPRKLLITTRYQVGDPQYQAVLKWDVNPRIDPKAFTFVPPPNALKIPYRSALVAGGGDK